ncbi:MAG: hypothetical protein WDO16_25855 [Bacteroidota bacterium]
MKSLLRSNWQSGLAFLLAIPTAWFVFINILNERGFNGPYKASQPILENLGIKESLGLNINLLILFGPVAACFLTLAQVVKIECLFTDRHFHFHFAIRKRWFPILTGAFSLVLMAILSFYLFGENCHRQ